MTRLANGSFAINAITVAYDAFGRQVEARDAAGVTTFAYDAYGANTNETVIGVAGTNTIERFTDAYGRDTGYALNGARQSILGYDGQTGRLATMETPTQEANNHHSTTTTSNYNSFVWTYLPGSDLKSQLAYPNGLLASWTYDANNQLLQVQNATPTNVISQYDYAYDAAGRRIACSRSGDAMTCADTIAYAYNARGELTNALSNVDADYSYSYQYDDIGNRVSNAECRARSTEYVANEQNQYAHIDTFTSESSCETFNPEFDDDGNQTVIQTSTGTWRVTYNGENRPVLWEPIEQSDALMRDILSAIKFSIYTHPQSIKHPITNIKQKSCNETTTTMLLKIICKPIDKIIGNKNSNHPENAPQ